MHYDHVLETGTLGNKDGQREIIAVGILVADVLNEKGIVRLLASMPPRSSSQEVQRGEEKIGFLDGHRVLLVSLGEKWQLYSSGGLNHGSELKAKCLDAVQLMKQKSQLKEVGFFMFWQTISLS